MVGGSSGGSGSRGGCIMNEVSFVQVGTVDEIGIAGGLRSSSRR